MPALTKCVLTKDERDGRDRQELQRVTYDDCEVGGRIGASSVSVVVGWPKLPGLPHSHFGDGNG
jgi:hypothetical protein